MILVAVITTSFSGAGRLAYSLGRHDMLPRAFGRLNRRTLISPATIVSTAAISAGILLIAKAANDPVRFLASLYSFGVLIAFTAAQVAVVRLRFTEPDLERPYRAPGNVRIRGTEVPVAALIGAPLTLVIWVFAFLTHDAARDRRADLARLRRARLHRRRGSLRGSGSSAASRRPSATSSPNWRARTSASSSR